MEKELDMHMTKLKKDSQLKVNMKAIIDASPLCLNLWNTKFENVMCNKQAVKLFDLSCEQEYLDRFFELSPVEQPNGRLSSECALEMIKQAFDTGHAQFNWMHCSLSGQEIPAEIILSKIDSGDDGNPLIAGFTRDLRPQLAGNNRYDLFEDFFFNYISDKMLFNALIDLSDELFFALDIRTSLIQYYGDGRKPFGLGENYYRFPDEIIQADLIYPKDILTFIKLSENMKNGVYEPIDVRFVAKDGSFHYYKVSYQTLYNKKNEPVFSIGKAVNIQREKDLEFNSTMDLLTNCLNKITAQKYIEDILALECDSQHALFIIDIDDFKAINDSMGHHFGDMVLCELAKLLKKYFRQQDIIGRIGGDEFVVFVRDVVDRNALIQQAKRIAESFHTICLSHGKNHQIAGSIGIACYPADADNYESLYIAADKALYQSKANGKNGYTFYEKTFADENIGNHTVLENANRLASVSFDAPIISSLFNLLYETTDMNATVNTVLQILGNEMQVDRCYIFETKDFGETYDNTYEWCADKNLAMIDQLQGLPSSLLQHFFTMASRDGVIYNSDLSLIKDRESYSLMNDQGITAFLQIQIAEKGFAKLVLGVDVCSGPRKWSPREVNSMLHAARLIATFLKQDRFSSL